MEAQIRNYGFIIEKPDDNKIKNPILGEMLLPPEIRQRERRNSKIDEINEFFRAGFFNIGYELSEKIYDDFKKNNDEKKWIKVVIEMTEIDLKEVISND